MAAVTICSDFGAQKNKVPCLFNFYAEYIMRNAGLEETQAGIKIGGRNINNLRYADDTTLMGGWGGATYSNIRGLPLWLSW